VAGGASLSQTGRNSVRSANVSRVPWRNSIGTRIRSRCAARAVAGRPAGWSGKPKKTSPRTPSSGACAWALRSTFIVGFPGETEAEFEELIAFLDEAQLDRAGCFAYSPVHGAAANALPGTVPEEVKEARRARFMQAQERISAQRLRRKIGKTLTVLVDEVRDDEAVARSNADAPEIDGQVFIARPRNLKPGDFATVRVTRAGTHDLWAVPA